MAGSRFIFHHDDSFTSGELGYPFHYFSDEENIDNDDDDDEYELLPEIPPSSSSQDRSSVGSIPWADDSVKKNQVDWERVERMMHGQEELPEEPELRTEILEWQRKFPQLFGLKTKRLQQSFESNTTNYLIDSLDIDSISNLSLNAINDQYEASDDGDCSDLRTPTNVDRNTFSNAKSCLNPAITHMNSGLIKHDKNLQIFSAPIKLCQRYAFSGTRSKQQRLPSEIETAPPTQPVALPGAPPPLKPISTHSTKQYFAAGNIATSAIHTEVKDAKMRMPPILNVLESKRRFRGLLGTNRSFVQLTHIPQAKSAATANRQPVRDRRSSAWHLPLAAAAVSNRFFNNRNSIILPAINLYREQEPMSSEDVDSRGLGNFSISSESSSDIISRQRNLNLTPQGNNVHNVVTSITTPGTTSSTGRSISAVHPHSYQKFNPFYFPYSASKFKSFK